MTTHSQQFYEDISRTAQHNADLRAKEDRNERKWHEEEACDRWHALTEINKLATEYLVAKDMKIYNKILKIAKLYEISPIEIRQIVIEMSKKP